ncbi:unnamed protein product [Trifolium pratense]|uniref:Uncharacterized protein n=1 Tax=Trifolium pratense TaxID=57577 RepID=A0ACB0J8Q9_TRIPR|nr:unnamed protein product [Trifolium pratense]
MDYLKSYMIFALVLFVILYSQVLTAIQVHDESPITEFAHAINTINRDGATLVTMGAHACTIF